MPAQLGSEEEKLRDKDATEIVDKQTLNALGLKFHVRNYSKLWELELDDRHRIEREKQAKKSAVR